jgi:galactose mutarotase-like enzyme
VEREMKLHGIADSAPWTLRIATGDSAEFFQRHDAASTDSYPWSYELAVSYSFPDPQTLAVTYTVTNLSASAMPFSIGNHISLHLPLDPSSSWAATAVRNVGKTELVRKVLAPGSLLSGAEEEEEGLRREEGLTLAHSQITDNVYGPRAADDGDSELALEVRSGSFVVTLRQTGAPALGRHWVMWGSESEGFWCPEPWLGSPDSLNTGLGRVVLAPGAEPWHYGFTLHAARTT